MKALIAVDALLYMTEDNKVWSKTIYSYDFWSRYLDVFDDIIICSRMKKVRYLDVENYLRCDGNHVTFAAMPMARGIKEYLLNFHEFVNTANNATKNIDCAIIRLPSIPATFVDLFVSLKRIPHALEVVVDPKNAFEGSKIASFILTNHLKRACLKANGVSYVTQNALQKDYPCKAHFSNRNNDEYFESYYSSIVLHKDYFYSSRTYNSNMKAIHFVHTANNVKNTIKGHDVAIRIIKKLNDLGYDSYITFIGDGEKRIEFEQLAKSLKIEEKVVFTGILPSPYDVRKRLIESDIFLFPTKCEGLPRAIIEAMAVGLPCLSTPVNGIPELLENDYLFDPIDVGGFTKKIVELINNPDCLTRMSERNIRKAYEFEDEVLRKRRNEFYLKLRNITLKKGKGHVKKN